MHPYRTIVQKIKDASAGSKLVFQRPKVGQLCVYVYDAKYRDTLPYWDRIPMVIPVDYAKNGFYGINFHYLDPKSRKILLKTILPFNTSKNKNIKSIKISYMNLKAMSSTMWKPCFHRYLWDHIITRIVTIPVNEWKDVINLPIAQFRRQYITKDHVKKSVVYANSKGTIK